MSLREAIHAVQVGDKLTRKLGRFYGHIRRQNHIRDVNCVTNVVVIWRLGAASEETKARNMDGMTLSI